MLSYRRPSVSTFADRPVLTMRKHLVYVLMAAILAMIGRGQPFTPIEPVSPQSAADNNTGQFEVKVQLLLDC